MRKKSKSAVKKSSHKKVIDAGFDSKTETSNNGLTNDTFDSDLLSSQDSDKISSFSSQDNLRFLVEEPIANEFSQEALSNFPTIVSAKTYIFVQLKLISVDSSCLYDRLENNCLCISSDACASHIKTFIYKKMNVSQSLYDVIFWEIICKILL